MFPLGPKGKQQRWVFISSCYLIKNAQYPNDGFHNSVTWWIGRCIRDSLAVDS